MDSMGQTSETPNTTGSDDHQRTPGIRVSRPRSMSSRHMPPHTRAQALASAVNRLEQEHVALLLALCELEESSAGEQDALMRSALNLLLRDELRRTQHALRRASLGVYGICEVCQQPLSRRQLSLLPAVTTCSSCMGRQPRERQA